MIEPKTIRKCLKLIGELIYLLMYGWNKKNDLDPFYGDCFQIADPTIGSDRQRLEKEIKRVDYDNFFSDLDRADHDHFFKKLSRSDHEHFFKNWSSSDHDHQIYDLIKLIIHAALITKKVILIRSQSLFE